MLIIPTVQKNTLHPDSPLSPSVIFSHLLPFYKGKRDMCETAIPISPTGSSNSIQDFCSTDATTVDTVESKPERYKKIPAEQKLKGHESKLLI